MKPLYRTLALVAVFGMFYAGMERKGSFDITEGKAQTQEVKPHTFAKKGSFDITEFAGGGGGGGGTGDVVIIG